MDPKRISEFAKLLRDSGDKVLNSDVKLTLSGQLLSALSDSFGLIVDQHEFCPPQTFQVCKPNNSKTDVFRDLQFIHDFIQKIETLCLVRFHCEEPYDRPINISKFHYLRKLEIQRINIKLVTGIQQLRAHLEELACIRCIESLNDIITYCGGDKCSGFIWSELQSADFSFNMLRKIDSSLEFTPWLQRLNLSHNRIVSVDAIKWLPNLKCLNLSYNQLVHVPVFHPDATRRLQICNLSNNCIEDLSGISRLDALTDLDLSDNCLLDHSYLLPLSTLAALLYLNLIGNPISCHTKHRQATARYLHKNTSTVKFLLDAVPLTKSEKQLTGTFHSYQSILLNRTVGPSSSSGQSTPSNRRIDSTPSSSVSSSQSLIATYEVVVPVSPITLTGSQSKKPRKRNAVITDGVEEFEQKTIEANMKRIETVQQNREHLETKKQIENLRNQFGDSWLQNHGAHMIQSGIGIQIDRPKTTITPEMLETFSPPKTDVNPVVIIPDEKTIIQPVEISDPKIEIIEEPIIDEDSVSDTEPNEIIYMAKREPSAEEVFIVISDTSLREKDVLNGRTKFRWTLKSMLSCERLRTNKIRLTFDTIKKDRKERIYDFDADSSGRVERFLRQYLAARPLSEMNQTVWRCANCATEFSRENVYNVGKVNLTCPQCRGTYLIEIKGNRGKSVEKIEPTPNRTEPIIDQMEQSTKSSRGGSQETDKSETHSSIGSANSLNESSSCSKISQSESSFDSNQSVAGSSNRVSDFDPSTKNNDSDVEILSNPSQSSIEILENMMAHRKYSADERRISQVPSLDTISDDTLRTVNQQTSTQDLSTDDGYMSFGKKSVNILTESSSSGSVTDSVCTAYEQNPALIGLNNNNNNNNKKKDQMIEQKAGGISSMLGGLFQSTNLLMSRSSKSNIDSNIVCDEFRFSYTDFDYCDHRLKLFLYQSCFEDDNEQLKWLVRGRMINDQQRDHQFPGIMVMSTTKWYIFEIFGKEMEDISKWLRRSQSGTIDRIELARVLPWKIGISFTIKGIGNLYLILQDILRTDSLLLYFANNPLPDFCTLEYEISERLSQKLLRSTDHESVKMLTILNKCDIDDQRHSDYNPIIITETKLVIGENCEWLADESDISIYHTQPMSNLVDVEKLTDRMIRINFFDETVDVCERWQCTFETDTGVQSTLDAISQSWEKLFGVPLASV